MARTEVAAYAHLCDADIAVLGRELDVIRRDLAYERQLRWGTANWPGRWRF